MIKRYSRKELTEIWSEENKYKIWLDVEIAAAQAMEKLGRIPRGVSTVVKKKAKVIFVKDRPGHDIEYKVNSSKIRRLGWKPKTNIDRDLLKTINYYKIKRKKKIL